MYIKLLISKMCISYEILYNPVNVRMATICSAS